MELNAEAVKKDLKEFMFEAYASNGAHKPYLTMRDALSLINSQEQRIGAQDMTISELRKRVEKAEHDADRYAQRIKELTEENERLRAEEHWISVKDKLPDNYRAVLVVCESTSISGGRLRAVGSYGGGFWSMADADGTMRLTKYMQYVVTHWMELPQMPNRKIDQIAKEMVEEG